MTRGLIATCYADLRDGVRAGAVRDAYRTAYGEEPFVRVVDAPPATKATLGSNVCLVFATVDERTRRLIAIAAIDNLVKGAAGSAIQNMNVALGFPEDAGLPGAGLWP
jgi:N-acetyl-gamma-glutamyl-phosphate reductase